MSKMKVHVMVELVDGSTLVIETDDAEENGADVYQALGSFDLMPMPPCIVTLRAHGRADIAVDAYELQDALFRCFPVPGSAMPFHRPRPRRLDARMTQRRPLPSGEPTEVHFEATIPPRESKLVEGVFVYKDFKSLKGDVDAFKGPCQRPFRARAWGVGKRSKNVVGLFVESVRVGVEEQVVDTTGPGIPLPVMLDIPSVVMSDGMPGVIYAMRVKNSTDEAAKLHVILHGVSL